MHNAIKEKFFKIMFMCFAIFSIVAVSVICIYLFVQGVPAIMEIGFFKFIFGTKWYPSENQFGILPMIVNSFYVTAFSIVFGVLVGVLGAIFIAKFCPKRLLNTIKQTIGVLAGIPSVIYGFFGMQVIIPLFSEISTSGNGYGLLASGIILGIMILPTVLSISLNSIINVSPTYYEGALSLGATEEQATFKVVVPAAKSGILAGIVLGVTRAIGETMAVVMVSGNSIKFADGLFGGLRTLTGNIVLEMGYAEGLHLDVLIATGVVLFVFVLAIIISFNLISNRYKNLAKEKRRKMTNSNTDSSEYDFKIKRMKSKMLKWATYAAIGFAVFFLVFIFGFILVRGVPYLSLNLLFGKFEWGGAVTMLPSIVTTLMMIVATLVIAVPIGVMSGIYLVEYTKKGSKLVKTIRIGLETLSGIPSIVYGLFGMLMFCKLMGMGYSILAGSLTLSIMILPTLVRTTEEALKEVPDSLREASLSLGASKTRTIFKIVLPNAISGIINGVVLSVGRIIGESAAVLFTVGSTGTMPNGLMSGGMSLSVFVYILAGENLHVNEAYAVAVVILALVIGLNVLSTVIENKIRNKKTKFIATKKIASVEVKEIIKKEGKAYV